MNIRSFLPAATVALILMEVCPGDGLPSDPLQNGGFESGFDGWTVSGNVFIRSGVPYAPTEGTKLLAFNAENSTPNGWISQFVSTIAGRTHKLEFDVGNLSYNSQDQRLKVEIFETVYGDTHTLLSTIVTLPGPVGGATNWIPDAYWFTPGGYPVTVKFTDVSLTTDALDLVLDKVRVTTSHYLSVTSSLDTPGPGVNIAVTPNSVNNLGSGVTPMNRLYFEGTSVTLTAPATAGGKTFHEWTKDGAHYSSDATVSLVPGPYTSMKAVYFPPIGIEGEGTFEARGMVGTGPFTPLSRFYTLHNDSSSALDWSAAPDSNWLTVCPWKGTLPAGGYVTLQLAVTAKALDLPAGSHGARLVVSSSLGTTEIQASLTVIDPTKLLTNGGFEAGLAAWEASGNTGIQSGAPYPPAEGTKLVAFNATELPPNGVVAQNFATEPGVRYSLDFDAGVLSYNTNEQQLRVEVRNVADGSPPAILDDTISFHGTGGGATLWLPQHYEFVAEGPLTRLTFQDVSPGTISLDLLLDHVRVSNPQYQLLVTTTIDENNGALGMGSGDSLREVLEEANRIAGSNLIEFAPALNGTTITLAGTQLQVDSEVAIDASGLLNGLTISAAGGSRVMDVSGNATVNHLTIRDGNSSSSPTPSVAGGIHNRGTLFLIDSRVEDCTSSAAGGGIENWGSLLASRSTISGNHAANYGGGLSNYGTMYLSDSTISGNSADSIGGGISCVGGLGSAWVVLNDSVVSGNSAGGNGGGYSGIMGYKSIGTLFATNTVFSGNSAAQSAGAINGNNRVELRNCTVAGNSCTNSTSEGGGIAAANYLTVSDTIIAGNSAAGFPNISNSTVISSGTNFIDGDPKLDSQMRPLAGSPVIDAAGNPSARPVTDQRGFPRISGPAMDIGAIEAQQIFVNTLADENDGIGSGGISLRDAISQTTQPVDLIRFAPALDGGTILLTGGTIAITGRENLGIDGTSLSNGLSVSGNGQSGVFNILFSGSVSISGLTLTEADVAISADWVQLRLDKLKFLGNSTNGGGAALKIGSFECYTEVGDCLFAENNADGSGGAIENRGNLRIRNCTFLNNHALAQGGAMWSGIYRGGYVEIRNSTFTGNSAVDSGGAIHAGGIRLIHSTVSGNSSQSGSGGGIFSAGIAAIEGAAFTTINSIIAGNTATTDPDFSGIVQAQLGANLIGGNAKLAPLADYGGTTPTMPPLPGSPAIDSAVMLAESPPADQRGSIRPNGALPDIGAVEAFPFSTLTPIDSDNDGIDDRLEPAYQLIVGSDDSGKDSDGDGSPDAEEIANMTDPADSASSLKIVSFLPAPGFDSTWNPVFDVTFISFPGLAYSLELSSDCDFHSAATRVHHLGTASDSLQTVRVTLQNTRDFLRVRRNP